MAIGLRVDEQKQLLIATAEGVVDDQHLIQFDSVLRENEMFQRGCPLLVDLTRLRPGETKLTGWGIYRIKELTEKDINMVAIVAVDEVAFGMARMYETIGNWCFDRIRVFKAMPEAYDWLSVPSQPLAEKESEARRD